MSDPAMSDPAMSDPAMGDPAMGDRADGARAPGDRSRVGGFAAVVGHDLPRITMLAGHAGTGKSECAVALALAAVEAGRAVTLVDLDVVNPYFRSREARSYLGERNVEVIGNSLGIDVGVDLPAIPGSVAAVLRNNRRWVVVDLGGDAVGARAIRQFRPQIPPEDTAVWYVVNACRPGNRDVSAVVASIRSVEAEIGLRCTGLVNNSHLLEETTCRTVRYGHDLCRGVTDRTGLPVVMWAARPAVIADCADRLDRTDPGGAVGGVDSAPVLTLGGVLRPTWSRSASSRRPGPDRGGSV